MDDWADPHDSAPRFIVWKDAEWERDPDLVDGHTFDLAPLVGYRARHSGESAALPAERLQQLGEVRAAAVRFISAATAPRVQHR